MASYNQEESDKPNPNLKEEVALKPELFNGKNMDNFHNLDFISGIDLKKFNDDLCQHYDFTVLDVISKQLFPNMIYILEKILHPMKDHPLYAFDLLWTGSTREGVNISEFDFSNLKEHRVHCELELDAMLVMKNFRIGPESTSQAVLCEEPETRPGYYWIRLLAAQCRNLWLPYCSKPKSGFESSCRNTLSTLFLFHIQTKERFEKICMVDRMKCVCHQQKVWMAYSMQWNTVV